MKAAEKEFLEIVNLLKNRLDQLEEDIPEADDYHRLFLYFVGEQFEGISPEDIKILRSKKEIRKIDFYDAAEDRFVVYQCKLPELENLQKKKSIITFGADLVNEAEDVFNLFNR